jgi:type I restriction-modification system DNA methylase subunit
VDPFYSGAVSSLLRPAPLFHPRVLPKHIEGHAFPADMAQRHEILRQWVASLRAGKLDDANEVKLHGEFLTRVFGDVLGYRTMAQTGAEGWELEAERKVGAGGKSADGALGFFQHGRPARVVAPIELKGAKHHLDRALGRVLTPVQQAWDYANHSPGCRWIIVSNYRETRLYSTARTPDAYEVFLLEKLEDPAEYKRFYYLLARETLLPTTPGDNASALDRLLQASARVEDEITKALYEEYRTLRKRLYVELGRTHSNLPAEDLLSAAQTILDRVLFVAFAEDRDLLPANTIQEACAYRDKYNPRPIWSNFQTIFRWIDQGNAKEQFPAYNGGLFQRSDLLDLLEVSDGMCEELAKLARYDFRDDVSVDVLGHIFEQSITDLEEMRASSASGDSVPPAVPAKSKRHAQGIYYTPAFITRFIVDRTLGRIFDERWQGIFAAHEPTKRKGNKEQTQAWIEAYEAYREELKTIQILDPACGSGAFLVAAFDALGREYERVNAVLAELRQGQVGLFDLTKTVLNNNLFGVDLNSESVEISKLSLWLKTAQRGRKLTYLDSNIKWGDSIVKDPDVSRVAFDWGKGQMARNFLDAPTAPEAAEIDARWLRKFDVVIGNPPYIRQELFTHLKDHLGQSYATYHGVADIFVYFFERGLSMLKPGGRLGFIVSNKWLRSGYAEPLRRMLAQKTEIETIVDFGHAPIFPDADTFPCIITMKKLADDGAVASNHMLSVTSFPREELSDTSIPEYVASHQHAVPQARLAADSWSLEPPGADLLLQKIRTAGTSLKDYSKAKPFRGLLTGLNEAFLVDSQTRKQLIEEHAPCDELIKKYLRGQDIDRWSSTWNGGWVILLKSSGDQKWPWTELSDSEAERVFSKSFPSLHNRLKPFEAALRKRTDKGRYWWELRSCAYYDEFLRNKLIYQEIQFHPGYALDTRGVFLNNKGFFLPSEDAWLLAILNSPLMWWHNWRYLPHMKDETLSPVAAKMEQLPIAPPTGEARDAAERMVPRLIAITKDNNDTRAAVLDSLRMQYDVEAPGQRLEDFASLDADAFIAEVLKRRRKSATKLKAAALKSLREMYDEEALPIQARRREAKELERALSELVNQAYGLTPEEIELMWSTAPPRMPVGR